MKITLIGPYPPFRGGISDFNYSLAKVLSKKQNLQIINFTTQYPKFLFPGTTQYKTGNNETDESNKILSSINPFSWLKSTNRIRDFDPEVVIIQYWLPFFAFAYSSVVKKISKKTSAKLISICHNIVPHEDKGIYKFLTKMYSNSLGNFVVMSDSVRKDLKYFNSNANCELLFHPVYDLFGSELDKDTAKAKLGLKDEKIILFFGLVREYKGLDILLKSIEQFSGELQNFKVLIAGECYENPQKYLSIIEQNNIKNHVRWDMEFIPHDQVKYYFSAADVVVLPYRSATQSGITQIAYNFNRPVIISDVGGLNEIVENGKTGFTVEPNAESFAKAILNFFASNDFSSMSEYIKIYKEQYSWDAFAHKLLDFAAK